LKPKILDKRQNTNGLVVERLTNFVQQLKFFQVFLEQVHLKKLRVPSLLIIFKNIANFIALEENFVVQLKLFDLFCLLHFLWKLLGNGNKGNLNS
jgi:hypothetical protein